MPRGDLQKPRTQLCIKKIQLKFSSCALQHFSMSIKVSEHWARFKSCILPILTLENTLKSWCHGLACNMLLEIERVLSGRWAEFENMSSKTLSHPILIWIFCAILWYVKKLLISFHLAWSYAEPCNSAGILPQHSRDSPRLGRRRLLPESPWRCYVKIDLSDQSFW